MDLARVTFPVALFLAFTATTATAQVMDDLNGVWTIRLDNKNVAGHILTESYAGIRIRLLPDGEVVELERDGDVLTSKATGSTTGITDVIGGGTGPADAASPKVRLTLTGLATKDKADDKLTGTWFGKKAVFSRDLTARGPIELNLAEGIGDRPWVRFMREVLIPKTAEDRETYHRFHKTHGGRWIMGTELGAKGYWITKGWLRDQSTFNKLFEDYHGTLNSPRSILSTRLNTLVTNSMRNDKKSEAGLALSQLGMYFSTASGGSVRLIITSNRDSIVYYITDKRAHERTGLVVNATPTHRPLASSFGKWQNDAGDMTLQDDDPYDRAVLEMMVKSNTGSMNDVSKTGRSAFTDYMGIMAIEDQRGVMFGNDDLDWGRNMTEASFIISVIRALGHGEFRQKPEYRKAPEKTITGEALALKSSFSGQLEPSRSITPKTIRIQATGLPVVLDDGDGTLYVEGTNPSDDSVGYVDYTDGSYNLSWTGFTRQARASYKDRANKAQTRTLRLTTQASVTLGTGKIAPKSVKISAPGFPDLVDDGEGSLYDVGANHETDDSRGYLDYDDGSVEVSWKGVPTAAITATFKTTTDAQQKTQTLAATSSANGLIDPLELVPGSVRITAGNGPALTDDGKGSLRYPNDAKSRGSVDYASGNFSVRWSGVPTQPIAASFRYGNNQTKSTPITGITVSADVDLAAKKVTPRSVRIKAGGLADVVDDGEGTLHDAGANPDDSDRGYIDYASGNVSINWSGVPTNGKATITYKSKAGEIVLSNQRELAMQVIVENGDESTLQPGNPSYIDILNGAENALEGGHKGGGDCQIGGMSLMEELTTQWLRAEHQAVLGRLETALAPFEHETGTDNIFASMTKTFYDNASFAKCTQTQATAIVDAGLAMFKTIRKHSRKLEAFILAHGVTKSDRWAPRASGF